MTESGFQFICEKCHTGYSKQQFENLHCEATPYVDGSDIFRVKITCSNCKHRLEFVKKGENGKLYKGYLDHLFFEEDEITKSYVESTFQLFKSSVNVVDVVPAEEFPSTTGKSIEKPPAQKRTPPLPPGLKAAPPTPSSNNSGKQLKDYAYTDMGNAERFIDKFANDIKYCPEEGHWYIWDKDRWVIVSKKAGVMRYAKITAKEIEEEAESETDTLRKRILKKHALSSQNAPKLKNMIDVATSDKKIQVPSSKFDSNNWIINVANGMVDLRGKSLKLVEHDKNQYITKIMPVKCKPDETCPKWENFLNTIMENNQGMIRFIQRCVGYALTGNTSEQCLFFLYGSGANGKSTFLETIRGLLGSYAQNADFNSFMKKDGIRNDLARLKGARFVSAIEAGSGQKFDERIIKMSTGQDTITTRFLYKEYFEYEPNFKIFLAANHMPKIEDKDHSIWRRIIRINFNVKIPKRKQDKNLRKQLEQEYPGIMNWAIEGCKDWQANGLNPPKEVLAAVEEYRDEMDPIRKFLRECCEIKAGEKIVKSELFSAYEQWCRDNDEFSITSNIAFGKKLSLSQKSITSCHSGNITYYNGVRLRGIEVPLPPTPPKPPVKE